MNKLTIAFSGWDILNVTTRAMRIPCGWSEDLVIAKVHKNNERAGAAARKKLSDSRLSGMQKDCAYNQNYQIKISNESPYTLSFAMLIGTQNRLNFLVKPAIFFFYPDKNKEEK